MTDLVGYEQRMGFLAPLVAKIAIVKISALGLFTSLIPGIS